MNIRLLSLAILATFWLSCEKDNIELSISNDCIQLDCITATNPNVIVSKLSNHENELIERVKKNYLNLFSPTRRSLHVELFGHAAWDLALVFKEVDDRFTRVYVPFFGANDISVQAVVMYTEVESTDESYLKLVPRGFVKNYPIREKLLKNNLGKNIEFSREFVVGVFSGLEQTIFNTISHDLYRTLPISSSEEVGFRDCQIVTRFQITDCWATLVNDVVVNIECSTWYEFETVGCGGAHSDNGFPSGSVTFGNGGSNGNGGTSGGDTPADVDPCVEDGRNCPPGDDDTEEPTDEIILIFNGDGRNNVSQADFPCIFDVVEAALSANAEQLRNAVQDVLGLSTNWNINVSTASLAPETNGVTEYRADPTTGAFNANIYINSSLEGCTQDRIYATLYHEMIHAYLGALWQFAISDAHPFSLDDFLEIYPTFVSIDVETLDLTFDQHEIMAQHFIHSMQFNLELFNLNLEYPYSRHMALSGLQGTSFWESMSTNEQNAALNTINQSRCNGVAEPSSEFNFIDCD